jgi:hypothetical protein
LQTTSRHDIKDHTESPDGAREALTATRKEVPGWVTLEPKYQKEESRTYSFTRRVK